MRHAHAEAGTPGGDFERDLSARGVQDAERVGRELAHRVLRIQVALTSPARRAEHTTSLVVAKLTHPTNTQTERSLYLGDAEAYIETIGQLAAEVTTALLVGHNPTISVLAHQLCCGSTVSLSPAEWLAIDFELPTWSELGPGQRGRIGS